MNRCLSFPPGFAFSSPHPLGDVKESSFLLTCRESGSLQGDGIRCRFIHETGCSPSYQPTDPLQSPAALVLLSLSASICWVSFLLFSPRSIHRLRRFASCRARLSSIRLLCARTNLPPTYLRLRIYHEMVAHGEIYLFLKIDKNIFDNEIVIWKEIVSFMC